MKYKIGDKVKIREDLEVGKSYNGWYFYGLMAEQMGKVVTIKDAFGNLEGYFYLIKELDDYYVWTEKMFSGLAEEPRNLIPLIAKELGVEIGEHFLIPNISDKIEYHITINGSVLDKDEIRTNEYMLRELLNGKYTIKKLPEKPKLTEVERVILENTAKKYKHVARDECGELYVYENKPYKKCNIWTGGSSSSYSNLSLFQHLFQFIKWEDKEPYKIQELLEEYENLRSE